MGVFEVLAKFDEKKQRKLRNNRAVIAARVRAEQKLARFVRQACNAEDLKTRLSLVEKDLKRIASSVASEYDADFGYVYAQLESFLKTACGCECDCPDECSCGPDCSCSCKANGCVYAAAVERSKTACACGCPDDNCDCSPSCPCRETGCVYVVESDKPKKKKSNLDNWHLISSEETNYQYERVDLPTADESGLGGPVPEINKNKSGDHTGWDLEPIDVGSVRNRLERQDADAKADYHDPDFDPSSPVRKRQDADQAADPPKGDRTKTWTGTEGLADPVTSKLRLWKLVRDANSA